MPDPAAPVEASFNRIEHFVVLMLENRSFDHVFGFLKSMDSRIEGLIGNESNPDDPTSPGSKTVQVRAATSFAMPYDPGHEFADVAKQLFGDSGKAVTPAPMNGFIASAKGGAGNDLAKAEKIMECFKPEQLTVMSALAQEFAVINTWYSSLPGPTWPNRFFVHAATSGGLTDSPSTSQIVSGYSFPGGTVYDRIKTAGRDWRIYHDGLPQTAGIDSLRGEYINIFTKNFREMKFFPGDVKAGKLPAYTFIEPSYDTGNNYVQGNSMHPLNDIRDGEKLVKLVYETLRASSYWDKMMLIVTFDEHGGFYDHVPPPDAMPTGDDRRYANGQNSFGFDRLGVRVPAVVVSAYTQKGTVIGSKGGCDPWVFDHSSVPATLEARFGLAALTNRDHGAETLVVAVNLENARTSAEDARLTLPNPAPDFPAAVHTMMAVGAASPKAAPQAPLSDNQRSFLDLAMALDLKTAPAPEHPAVVAKHEAVTNQAEAAAYIRHVEAKIHSRRVTKL